MPYGPVFVVSWSGQLDCLKGRFSLYRAQDSYGLLYGPVSDAVVGRLDSLKQPHQGFCFRATEKRRHYLIEFIQHDKCNFRRRAAVCITSGTAEPQAVASLAEGRCYLLVFEN